MNTNLPLILGSTSVFRQTQLQHLGITFQTATPDYDETPHPNETAAQTALRLAIGKARSLSTRFPRALIIGADQVAWCNGRQLGKPNTVANAQRMLADISGQQVEFYSALCLFNSTTNTLHTHVDKTTVGMRALSRAQICRYLEREPDAVYCAGAAKSEGLGAALLTQINSTDPNALIGIPLFKLIDFLAAEGVEVL